MKDSTLVSIVFQLLAFGFILSGNDIHHIGIAIFFTLQAIFWRGMLRKE